MATVTVEDTTETNHTAKDSKGRTIAVRKLNVLDRMKLFECVGAENSKNDPYMEYATLAWHVTAIAGEPVTRPAKKPQLEALVSRLGEEGLVAVALELTPLYGTTEEAEELLKNASGTPASANGSI